MDSFAKHYGPWALVTGAASGLGEEFAYQLAQLGVKSILLDQDAKGLQQVETVLSKKFATQSKSICVDLASDDFFTSIEPVIQGLDIGLVINNAGVNKVGLFEKLTLDDHLLATDVNVKAPLALTHYLLPRLRERGSGGIIFVSSLSALQGTAFAANYAATKAWNLVFAEGLWAELSDTNIDVLGYLVGSTDTPGFNRSKPNLQKAKMVKVSSTTETVQEALASIKNGPIRVAGGTNKLTSIFLSKLIPRRWAVRLVSNTTKIMYGRQ